MGDTYIELGDIGTLGTKEIQGDDMTYSYLQGAASKVNQARMVNALNAILIWSKCIKYIGFFPYLQFLFQTVKDSMEYFLYYLVVFGVLHMAFVTAFMAAFGDVIEELTDPGRAWIFTLRSVLADMDVFPIYTWDPVTGGVFILLFYIVLLLVAANAFFAIMACSLMEGMYSPRKPPTDKEQAVVTML